MTLRMKLDVPGSAGALTTAADRKLQEGQRVSSSSVTSKELFLLAASNPLPSSRDEKYPLFLLPQQNLRQLRLDLQKLGVDLQSGERACCRNTGGERLRHTLTAADDTLAKQVQQVYPVKFLKVQLNN